MRTIGVCFALLLAACEPEPEETPCTHDPPLTYENFGRGFTEQYCNGCHSSLVPPNHRNDAPEEINFDTYEGLLYWADLVQEQTVLVDDPDTVDPYDPLMPPGGGPTQAELVLYDEWLQCELLPDAQIYWSGGGPQ